MSTLQVPSTKESDESAGPVLGLVGHTTTMDWLDHETLIGYPGDKFADNEGVTQILECVSLLEEAGIPCCITDIMALDYYGVPLVRNMDWKICVPSISMSKAEELIRGNSAKYIPFRPDIRWNPAEPICKLPRFKCTGFALFFILVSSEEICFSFDDKDAIVCGITGLPFPGLRAYVQSLVDSKDFYTLEYLIDGMDLSEEWGDASGVKFEDEILPEGVRTKREWWHKLTTSKQKRLSWKLDPKHYATNYRLRWKKYDPKINSWL